VFLVGRPPFDADVDSRRRWSRFRLIAKAVKSSRTLSTDTPDVRTAKDAVIPTAARTFLATALASGYRSSRCFWTTAINPSIFRQSSTSTRSCVKARFSRSGL